MTEPPAADPLNVSVCATESTRERIITAAGEVFADHGFRAATVRQITDRAGVNIAAVNYHFRDKGELYAQVLLHAHSAAMRADLLAAAAVDAGPAAGRLRAFVGVFLRYLLDPTRPGWHARLKARELAAPTPALDRLVDEAIRPMANALRTILRHLVGPGAEEERINLLCGSVLGQCLYYSQCRPIIERCLPAFSLNHPADVERLADHITEFSLPAIRRAGQPAPSPAPAD